jgi:hypothetical protein
MMKGPHMYDVSRIEIGEDGRVVLSDEDLIAIEGLYDVVSAGGDPKQSLNDGCINPGDCRGTTNDGCTNSGQCG